MMKRLCVCMIALLATTATTWSQTLSTRIEGVVTDSTGVPVPWATIRFSDGVETFYAYTDTAGRYGLTLPSGVSDYDAVSDNAPAVFTLGQNYPNPFNPSTTIPFSLETTAPVRLDVFSILGQRVRTLIDDTLDPGEHTVVWDSRDDGGRGVSAGVYFYRLRAGASIASGKMLLLDGGFSGGGSGTPVRKVAVESTERQFQVYGVKLRMADFQGGLTISPAETVYEYTIVFPDTYRPFRLFFGSAQFKSEFFHAGETISISLAEVCERWLPATVPIRLTSTNGDIEDVVASGRYALIDPHTPCKEDWWDPYSSLRATIPTSDAPMTPGDGILEVSSSDTVTARWITTDHNIPTVAIVVVDSLDYIELWGKTYVSWNGYTYMAISSNRWEETDPSMINIRFSASVTTIEIDAFFANYSEIIQSTHSHSSTDYSILFQGRIDLLEFMRSQVGNPILSSMAINIPMCVWI